MPRKAKGKTTKTYKGYKKSNKLTPAKVQSMIKKTIYKQSETKMFPLETTFSSLTNALQGQIINISQVATQGTDNEQRIGDRIRAIGCEFRFILSQTNGDANAHVRVILYISNRNEFSTNNDAILLSTSNEPIQLTAGDATDLIRSVNKKQVKVLFDKQFILSKADVDNAGTGAVGNGNSPYKMYRKFFKLNHDMLFPVDGSGEAERGNVRLLFVSRNVASATHQVDGECMTRFYYKDF